MANPPPLTQEQQDTAVLQQIKNVDGSRKYSDEQIKSFPEQVRANKVQAARKDIIKKSLRTQSDAAKTKLATEILSSEDRALYQEQILTNAEIEETTNKLVEFEGNKSVVKEITTRGRQPSSAFEKIIQTLSEEITTIEDLEGRLSSSIGNFSVVISFVAWEDLNDASKQKRVLEEKLKATREVLVLKKTNFLSLLEENREQELRRIIKDLEPSLREGSIDNIVSLSRGLDFSVGQIVRIFSIAKNNNHNIFYESLELKTDNQIRQEVGDLTPEFNFNLDAIKEILREDLSLMAISSIPEGGEEEEEIEPVKPEDFTTKDGEVSKPLSPEENVPSVKVSIKQKEARTAPPEVAKPVKDQIENPKEALKLTPIGGLTEMDLFIEPVLRQCYTLIAAKPTGGFYLGMHIPCGYPIILPVFYPVTLVGKAPAGAIAMKFLGSNKPYCEGSTEFDISILADLGIPSVDVNQSPVEPCNPNLEFEQLAECVKAFNEQARNELGPMEVPESLRAIMALIAAQQAQPAPAPVVPATPVTPQEQIDIFVKDGLDQFDFELEIIE